jgi:hypothetical protein
VIAKTRSSAARPYSTSASVEKLEANTGPKGERRAGPKHGAKPRRKSEADATPQGTRRETSGRRKSALPSRQTAAEVLSPGPHEIARAIARDPELRKQMVPVFATDPDLAWMFHRERSGYDDVGAIAGTLVGGLRLGEAQDPVAHACAVIGEVFAELRKRVFSGEDGPLVAWGLIRSLVREFQVGDPHTREGKEDRDAIMLLVAVACGGGDAGDHETARALRTAYRGGATSEQSARVRDVDRAVTFALLRCGTPDGVKRGATDLLAYLHRTYGSLYAAAEETEVAKLLSRQVHRTRENGARLGRSVVTYLELAARNFPRNPREVERIKQRVRKALSRETRRPS